jgi:outer membrane beta-barrel protein
MKIFPLMFVMFFGSAAYAEEETENTPIAQDDDSDDPLDDESLDGPPASSEPEVTLLPKQKNQKQIIKTLQRKTFLKLKRWEVSPHVAFVTNDPFLNRYIVGTGIAYNFTEIFAMEGMVDFSPDLGDADWKPLTKQLVEENSVSPDISKLQSFGSFCFIFSPLYGKGAVLSNRIINFDIYGKFGMGITQTKDDLEALQAKEDPRAQSTEVQSHATTNFGAGAKIIFNQNMAVRVEGRSMIYIEAVNATTLEMKNNFILQFSASFFFPNIKT